MAFYDSCLKENSNNKVGLPGVWKFQTSLSGIQQAEDDTSNISHPELPRWLVSLWIYWFYSRFFLKVTADQNLVQK